MVVFICEVGVEVKVDVVIHGCNISDEGGNFVVSGEFCCMVLFCFWVK